MHVADLTLTVTLTVRGGTSLAEGELLVLHLECGGKQGHKGVLCHAVMP